MFTSNKLFSVLRYVFCLSLFLEGSVLAASGFFLLFLPSACFLFRLPHVVSLWSLFFFIGFSLGVSFLSSVIVLLCKGGLRDFMLHFCNPGVPVSVAPFVIWGETISFLTRFPILLLRPLINFGLGSFAVIQTAVFFLCCPFCNTVYYFWVFTLFFESFVFFVQWYIAVLIVSFTLG